MLYSIAPHISIGQWLVRNGLQYTQYYSVMGQAMYNYYKQKINTSTNSLLLYCRVPMIQHI